MEGIVQGEWTVKQTIKTDDDLELLVELSG